jgi:phenylacetate-CoA ligase
MHVCEDHFIPEIVDPDTLEPLPAGEQGELVFTCITKEAFPLIRYRTRDIARLDYTTCDCGRTLVRMMKPQGRTDDMLIIKGVNVFPSQIESALLGFDELATNYLIVVDRVGNFDTLELHVPMRADMGNDMGEIENYRNRAREVITSAIGVGIKIKLVDSLPQSIGKAVRVQDRRGKSC